MNNFEQPPSPTEKDFLGMSAEEYLETPEKLKILNVKLGEQFTTVKEFYDVQNQILDVAGEVWRLEHLLGKNGDASLVEKIMGRIMGGKEDTERLETVKRELADLKTKKDVLEQQVNAGGAKR